MGLLCVVFGCLVVCFVCVFRLDDNDVFLFCFPVVCMGKRNARVLGF